MLEHNKEDIYDKLDLMFISLIPYKLIVGIIGGGRGAYIKARTFASHGCKVSVLARGFIEEFKELNNIEILKDEYKKEFIKDKHLIIIGVDQGDVEDKIICDCKEETKLFFTLSSYEKGMGTVPAQCSLGNISYAVNTKGGNPKAAIMLRENLKNKLYGYDSFIGFINNLRNKAKNIDMYGKEIIEFIATEDYRFMWEKGKAKEGLMLFFPEDIINELFD